MSPSQRPLPLVRARTPFVPASRLSRCLLPLLCAAAATGCGNKGELYLPASLEDERALERIDASLRERTPPEAVPPGLQAPGAAPQPDETDADGDVERDVGRDDERDDEPAQDGAGT